jgi:5-methylcytosine-specific restriction endonuclease McrA
MIQKKKKNCKNCKTEQFIWKAGLCKSCSSILNPPKKISYKSAKQKLKDVDKREYINKQFKMFFDIWSKKRHYCESCGLWLGNEPLSIFFDHLLEKSKYPEFALMENNIYLCCGECHTKKTNGFPTENHKKAIKNIKNLLSK